MRDDERAMHYLSTDDQGFNPIYMMLDSGARGSKNDPPARACGA